MSNTRLENQKEERTNQERGGIKRIPSFLNRLEEITVYGNQTDFSKGEIAQYRKAVNALCKAEIAYMRKALSDAEGNVSVQTLHRYISDYRNAVRDTYAEKEMPEMYGDPKGRKVKTHIAVKYLAMTKDEKEQRKQLDIDAKNLYTDLDTQGRLIIASPKNLINKANELLRTSDNFYELVAALLAVTGRRPIEILSTAKFEAIEVNKVLFEGQAKTREATHARDSFEIFTLAPAALVVSSLEKIRTMRNFDGLTNRQIESRTSGYLGIAVRDHFGDVLEHGDLITPKSLRGIWVNIAHHLFKPMSIDSVFATNQLGHATPNGQSVSRASADNYMQFFAYPFSQEKIQEILAIIVL